MQFRCRVIYMVVLALIFMCLFSSLMWATAESIDELNITENVSQSVDVEASLKAFDVSTCGEVLLMFQDSSPHGICTIQIFDLDGLFVKEYVVRTSQSGSILACFSDTGEILLHFVRSNETYVVDDGEPYQVSVSEDGFFETEVPPIAQGGRVSHTLGDDQYTLLCPGLFDAFLYGHGYKIVRQQGSGVIQIWTGGGNYIKGALNRSLMIFLIFFNVLSLLLVILHAKTERAQPFSRGIIFIRIALILITWILMMIIETGTAQLMWQDINSVGMFICAVIFMTVSALHDWFILRKSRIG